MWRVWCPSWWVRIAGIIFMSIGIMADSAEGFAIGALLFLFTVEEMFNGDGYCEEIEEDK